MNTHTRSLNSLLEGSLKICHQSGELGYSCLDLIVGVVQLLICLLLFTSCGEWFVSFPAKLNNYRFLFLFSCDLVYLAA